MTLTVWKYEIPLEDEFEITMPVGAELLMVSIQAGQPQLWVRVDPAAPTRARAFRVVGTGYPGAFGGYVGSFMLRDGALVFHLFER